MKDRRTRLETRVRDPRDGLLLLLEPLGQGQRVGDVALHAQRERLDTEQDLLRRERVERGTEVTQGLDAELDGKGDVAKLWASARKLRHRRTVSANLRP